MHPQQWLTAVISDFFAPGQLVVRGDGDPFVGPDTVISDTSANTNRGLTTITNGALVAAALPVTPLDAPKVMGCHVLSNVGQI